MKQTQGLSIQKLKKNKTRCRDIWMKSRHQHCIRSRRNISLQGESCRDNIRLSRKQLYRKEVATTPGCRDISCMDQEVETRSSCRDTNFTSNLSQPHRGLRQGLRQELRQGLRQELRQEQRQEQRSRRGHDVATTSAYWASLLKSNKKCLEIRAQLQNPINM